MMPGIETPSLDLDTPTAIQVLRRVLVPSSRNEHDIEISPDGHISSITESRSPAPSPHAQCLVLPSLCHPHIHLDKPYLLTHPSTSHLQPKTGTFQEALSITSEAKRLFPHPDGALLERMNTLVADSVRNGVTALRAFCEVDNTVGLHCIKAGLRVKELWKQRCHVQICAFAQDPVFSGENGDVNRGLMEEAIRLDGVDVLGATPYVEKGPVKQLDCIRWAIETSRDHGKSLDLHLDYNVDVEEQPRVWDVLKELKSSEWFKISESNNGGAERTVCLGHCTRLTLFQQEEWKMLKEEIADLPVYFVGLPSSDLFMMDRPDEGLQISDRRRATLQIPAMINYGLNGAIGVNNVGNAFTPYGSGDPLELARWGVGIYQVGTGEGAEELYECISSRAKEAIGLSSIACKAGTGFRAGDSADFVVIGKPEGKEGKFYRRRRSVKEVVWDAGADRKTIYQGHDVSIN